MRGGVRRASEGGLPREALPVKRRSAAGGGLSEIRDALSESRRLFLSIGLFSAFVNLLMLTGPLLMLQVYDRVLTSRSEATLVALIAIVAFLFLTMGLLDHARARVLARAGARFQARLDPRVLGAILTRAGRSPQARSAPATGLHDLEAMQRFASGPGPFAFFDAPWTPAFLFVLFTFHWLLGVLAAVSGVLLVALALVNSARTARLQAGANEAAAAAFHFVEQVRGGAETVRGLGMRRAATGRAGALRSAALAGTVAASDRGGAYAVASRTLRLFLQSMMLGLGAWLAIRGEVTPGIMIAAAILLGRALAPIDQAVAQWPTFQRALQGWRSLAGLLRETPEEPERTPLPVPEAVLEAENLVVAAPGAQVPAVRGVSFRLEPGHAIGVTRAVGFGQVDAGPRAGRGVAAAGRQGDAGRRGARPVRRGGAGAPSRLAAAGGGAVRGHGGGEHRPARPRTGPGRGGRGGDAGRRPRDDPGPAGRLRLRGGGRRRGAVGRAAPADRAGPRVLRRPRGGRSRRAGRASGCGGRGGAKPGGGGVEAARRRRGHRGASACGVRRMRPGAGDGARSAPARRRPAGAARRHAARDDRCGRAAGVEAGAATEGGRGRAALGRRRRRRNPRGPGMTAPPAPVQGLFPTGRPLLLGFLTLAVLGAGLFGWGTLASISGAVIATGRVEVATRAQVVEHIDGGTVSAILVRNGDRVAAGDVLLRFDDAVLSSEAAILAAQHDELVSRRNRLEAEVGGAAAIAWDTELARRAGAEPAVRAILDGQQRLFEARRASRAGLEAQLRERIAQTRKQVASLEAQAGAVRRQGGLVDRELKAERQLFEQGLTELRRLVALERGAAELDGQAGDIEARIAGARRRTRTRRGRSWPRCGGGSTGCRCGRRWRVRCSRCGCSRRARWCVPASRS